MNDLCVHGQWGGCKDPRPPLEREGGVRAHAGGSGLNMEGASQRDWWGRTVLPSLLGGCVLRGAERKTPDELARELSEAAKPKLYAYHGYADAYLRATT